MPRGNGGVIGPANIPTTSVAKGVWSLMEQQLAQRQGIWPSGAIPTDPYFEYTTLLLPGNGTNGAQNNTFLDGSTNNFTITRNGNTTQGTFSPFSQTGWGAYFDGASDYIQFTNSDFSVSTGDFTAEWWMFVTSDKSQVGIITAASNANLTIGYGSGSANARQVYVEWGGSGAYIGSMSNYANSWVHICVMKSSGTVYTFQNGTLLSSASKSAALGSTANMVIGTNSGDIAAQSFPGYLSNVRFSKVAVYSTSGFTPSTSPLTRTSQGATNVQFLTLQSNRFLDSDGVNTPASSPLTITKNGDTSVVAFSPFNPSAAYSTATNGGSGYFDGTGDKLTATANAAFQFGTGDFCIEFWIYPVSLSGYQTPIDMGYGSSGSYVIQTGNGNGIPLFASAGSVLITSSTAWTVNSFNHVVVCRSGTTLSMFLNGLRTATVSNSTNFNSNSTLGIGAAATASSDYPINGYMSNARLVKGFAVYDPTLTTLTVPTAPPTNITNTSLLLNFTNAGVYDATSKNDLETAGDAQISSTAYKWGSTSIKFDGTGDWLLSTPSVINDFGTGNFTIEAWIYMTSTSNYFYIYNSSNANFNSPNFTFLYDTSLGLRMYAHSGIYTVNQGSTSGWVANTWYYVALVRNGGTITLYRNNTSLASGSTFSGVSFGSATAIPQIGGSSPDSRSNNGYIQDLRVSRYARDVTTTPTAAFPLL